MPSSRPTKRSRAAAQSPAPAQDAASEPVSPAHDSDEQSPTSEQDTNDSKQSLTPAQKAAARDKKDLSALSDIAKGKNVHRELILPLSKDFLAGLSRADEANEVARSIEVGFDKEETQLMPSMPSVAVWSLDDEAALIGEIAVAPPRKVHEKSLLALCKASLRFFQVLPMSIVSAENNLKSDGWSHRFNDHLAELLTHPLFQGDKGLLVTAVQYAAICRTDDRRIWPLVNHTWDTFFDEFLEVMKLQDGKRTIVQLHREVRTNLTARDNTRKLPYWSQLFTLLEEAHSIKVQPAQAAGLVVYQLKTDDLVNLCTALDRLQGIAFQVYPAVVLNSRVHLSGTRARKWPSRTDLDRIVKKFDAADRRTVKIAQRLPPPPAAPSLAQGRPLQCGQCHSRKIINAEPNVEPNIEQSPAPFDGDESRLSIENEQMVLSEDEDMESVANDIRQNDRGGLNNEERNRKRRKRRNT